MAQGKFLEAKMATRSFRRALALDLIGVVSLASTADVRAVDMPALADISVIDQHGATVDVRADLAARQVVVMMFFYTTSTTLGPPMGANFGKLQELLGLRAGGEVSLISVSVDPVSDTPARLRAWGEKFGAGPGWTFWTGEKSQIDKLLKKLQVFTPDFADHSPIVLIFDRRGAVTRIDGLAAPKQLLQAVDGAG